MEEFTRHARYLNKRFLRRLGNSSDRANNPVETKCPSPSAFATVTIDSGDDWVIDASWIDSLIKMSDAVFKENRSEFLDLSEEWGIARIARAGSLPKHMLCWKYRTSMKQKSHNLLPVIELESLFALTRGRSGS